ncbi:SDR family NAD(P)-dependent oxidoreductase [Micromonospora sp. CPCC 205539]|uniref:SDR family NAD(P)-dependent oxidoreductase n=1 Tax=Micromonospora sp. CPCC 205539 TaxID=3122408 RepID=UPI002FEF6619
MTGAGPVDVLVSNAGQTVRGPVEHTPADEIARIFDLNVIGAVRVTQEVLPGMRERGKGRLRYVSSLVSQLPIPLIGARAASKRALEALAETLAEEVHDFGIDVVVLQPGAVSSNGPASAASFLDENGVYGPLALLVGRSRGAAMTPQEVAVAIADAVEVPSPAPLRLPVGDAAHAMLAANRKA